MTVADGIKELQKVRIQASVFELAHECLGGENEVNDPTNFTTPFFLKKNL